MKILNPFFEKIGKCQSGDFCLLFSYKRQMISIYSESTNKQTKFYSCIRFVDYAFHGAVSHVSHSSHKKKTVLDECATMMTLNNSYSM